VKKIGARFLRGERYGISPMLLCFSHGLWTSEAFLLQRTADILTYDFTFLSTCVWVASSIEGTRNGELKNQEGDEEFKAD
jgi:hypothetical protein